MNLLAINASHRGDKGQKHIFVERLFHGAHAAGADCEEVLLARLKINRRATQRRANQEVVPLPFFRWLKHLQPVKQKVIDYMRKESLYEGTF